MKVLVLGFFKAKKPDGYLVVRWDLGSSYGKSYTLLVFDDPSWMVITIIFFIFFFFLNKLFRMVLKTTAIVRPFERKTKCDDVTVMVIKWHACARRCPQQTECSIKKKNIFHYQMINCASRAYAGSRRMMMCVHEHARNSALPIVCSNVQYS